MEAFVFKASQGRLAQTSAVYRHGGAAFVLLAADVGAAPTSFCLILLFSLMLLRVHQLPLRFPRSVQGPRDD